MEKDSDFKFFDVRANEIHEVEHPVNCLPLSLDDIEAIDQKTPDLKKATPIYIICYLGNTSLIAGRRLFDLGFTNVFSVNGGFKAWQDENLPVVKAEPKSLGKTGGDFWLSKDKFDLLGAVEDPEIGLEDKSEAEQIRILKSLLDEERQRGKLGAQLAMLGELSAGIIHEINSPLTIVKSGLAIMSRSLEKALASVTDKNEKEKFRKVESAALKLNGAMARITTIVTTVKSISYNSSLEPIVDIKLANFLNEIVFISAFKSRKVSVSYELSVGCHRLRFRGHKNQLTQILVNLTDNAIDAIEESNQSDPWVVIRCHNDSLEYGKKKLYFSVTDSGEGIPREVQEKIGNPLFTTKPVGKGTRLGMGVMKKIIESHNGDFFIDNSNKNTSFVFSIEHFEI